MFTTAIRLRALFAQCTETKYFAPMRREADKSSTVVIETAVTIALFASGSSRFRSDFIVEGLRFAEDSMTKHQRERFYDYLTF